MTDTAKHVWVPDEKDLFTKACIVSESQETVTVRIDKTGETKDVDPQHVEKMNPAQFDQVGDMAESTYLNEPSVVYNLSERWFNDRIYTYSGLFLVAVNPYKPLSIYGENSVLNYKGKRREDVEPHIYAVAEQAYRSMLETSRDQSILITGESGAGKTENTKKAIQYLSSVTHVNSTNSTQADSSSGIDERILQTNPILEAFGNAQTIRNANSSRFGKFIKINFNHAQKPRGLASIAGASIEWYLLEKSRVVTQHNNERNYHVFYQLLAGAPDSLKKRLQIPEDADPKSFTYLASGASEIEGVDDAEHYSRLVEAFRIMGFSTTKVEEIMTIVAAILSLGEIKFRASSADQGQVVDSAEVDRVSNLSGVPSADFINSVVQPRVKIGREVSTQSRTASQAQHTINAVAKAFYERLFGYIVEQLNERLGSGSTGPCIGVLDIAGFEIFEKNSFEQLCINYTNEKLQQFFNHHMFVLEQEEYVKEKVDWEYVDYGADLQPTIDLIEKSKYPMGIFSCLNEESSLPSGSEESFNDKLTKQWDNTNPKFTPSRLSGGFKIDHYAQTVDYSTDGWIEKNKDPLSDSVEAISSASNNALVRSSFTPKDGMKVKAKSMFRTVAQRHKEQSSDLMMHLEATHPHFVRCILPNAVRSPNIFDNRLVLDQLRYNGVLEGIRIARSGFPNRSEFAEFFRRYRALAGIVTGNPNSQQTCATILNSIHLDPTQYKVGLSKIFFRNGVLADLEHKSEKLLKEQTTAVQAFSRGALVRMSVKSALHRRQAAKVLAATFRMNNKNASDPWWQVTAGLKPLLSSKENMDNSKKDIRMQKLETSLNRSKEEQVELISSKNELRGELIAASKEKESLTNTLDESQLANKEQVEAHELAINSAKLRDEASRAALAEISKSHSDSREQYDKLKSANDQSEAVWKEKIDAAIKEAQDAAAAEQSSLKLQSKELSSKQEEQLSTLNKSLNEAQTAYHELKKNHEDELSNIKSERDMLSKQLEEANALGRDSKEALEMAQENAKQSAAELTEQKSAATEHKEQLSAIESKKNDINKQSTTLQSEFDVIKTQQNAWNQERDAITEDKEALKKDFKAKLESLQLEVREANSSKQELVSQLTTREESSKRLKSDLDNKTAELEKSSAELTKIQGWLAKATTESKAAADTKKSLIKLEADHKLALKEIEDLKKLKLENEKMSKNSAETDKLRRDLDIATENLLKSDEEFNKSRAELSASRSEASRLSSRVEKLSSDLTTLKSEVLKTTNDLSLVRSDRDSIKAHNDEIKIQVLASKKQLFEKEGKLTESAKELADAQRSLEMSKATITELNGKLATRRSSGPTSPVVNNFDAHRKSAETRKELADTQKTLLKLKTQSLPPDVSLSPYKKRFGQGDAEQELAFVKHDLAAAEAQIKEYEQEIKSAKEINAQFLVLRQKYEKLQREKAALARDRSQLLLGAQNTRGQSRELEIAKAQAADVKRMQSELNVLKLELVRSERKVKEMSAKLADAANEKDLESLKHRLRLAEIAKLQLSKTVQELSNPSSRASTTRAATQIRSDDPLRNPSASGEPADPNDPPLVVQKRGVEQALRNISNDRRVSENAHLAAERVKKTDLEEAVEIYKRRAGQFHAKLEKAETVVQAALRAEASSKEQAEEYKTRSNRIEEVHMKEISEMRKELIETRKRLDDRESTIERLKLKSGVGAGLQGQMRSVNGTLKDVTAERDRLMVDKTKLENRLQDLIASMNHQPRKSQEELMSLRQNEQQMMMEQSELRWKIERKERYLDTMRRNLADADARYEESRVEIERLQATDASREIVLRRATREIAEAKERYLMAERELEQYRQRRTSPARQHDNAPVFI